MDDAIRVQIVKTFDDIAHNPANVVLCEGGTSKNLIFRVKVHYLALLGVFVNQINMAIALTIQKLA